MGFYQNRVVEEKEQLDIRLHSLRSFIGGDRFKSLSMDEQLRMKRQEKIMSLYVDVLDERIAAFRGDAHGQETMA